MRTVLLVWLSIVLLPVTFLPAMAQDKSGDTQVRISVWAVLATFEQRNEPHFDRGLEVIRATVSELRYDTYRNLNTIRRQSMKIDDEFRVPIDERYTLYIKPLACDEDRMIRLQLRMEMQPRDREKEPVIVLQSRQILSQNQKMIIGGPRLDNGDLVIVLEASQ